MRLRRARPIALSTADTRRAFQTFRSALSGQRRRIGVAVVVSLAATGLELLKPWPVAWVLDYLVQTPDPGSAPLRPIVLFAAMALAIPGLLGIANEQLQILTAKVSRKATVRIRSDVFDHLQRLELSEHHRHSSGDLVVRLMGDVNMIRDLLFPTWLNLLSRGSVLIGASVVYVIVDWRLFLVTLIPLPLLWVGVERTTNAVKSAAGKQRRKEGKIAATAAESIRQVGIIKALVAEDATSQQFRTHTRSAERASMVAARQSARMSRLTEILTGVGVGLVLVLGAVQVRSGKLTAGQLVLVISYTRMVYKPIRKLTGEGARVGKATACALRVMELLDRPVEPSTTGAVVGTLDGDIEFRSVSHEYNDGRRSVSALSCTLPAGALTVVSGENGSGKSTMLSLLLRLYQPESGSIFIGGRDIQTYKLWPYRAQIAFVPQELALFSGTIRENLVFGNTDVGPDELRAACDVALFTPVLESLPDGLDTVLEEDGASLSGGQARRLMLARASLRDASLLLLDEPLTGLDSMARPVVAAAIANIARGRTTVVVHHGDVGEIGPTNILHLDAAAANGSSSSGGSTTLNGGSPTPAPAELADLLESDSAAEILRAVCGEARVIPEYVRYKPGETAIVSYRFEADGGLVSRGYARWCSDPERARTILAKARTMRPRTGPLGIDVASIGSNTVLYGFPNDARLRRLRWFADPRKVKRSLAPVVQGPLKSSSAVSVLRYKPERRIVCRVDARTDLEERSLLIRYSTGRHATRLARTAEALVAAGVGTARPVAQLEQGRVSVDEMLPGTQLRDVVRAGCHPPAEFAGELARFHRTPMPAGTAAWTADTALDRALSGLADVECWVPGLNSAAAALAETLEMRQPESDPTPVLVHGDLHGKNVLVHDGRSYFIDLERVGVGSLESDLGQFLGHSISLGVRAPGWSPGARIFALQVIDSYACRTGSVSPARLQWYTALALVDQALLVTRHLHADRAETASLLLEAAAGIAAGRPLDSAL